MSAESQLSTLQVIATIAMPILMIIVILIGAAKVADQQIAAIRNKAKPLNTDRLANGDGSSNPDAPG